MFHLVKSWGSLVSCHRANIGFDSDRMPNFRSRKLKPRISFIFFCRNAKRRKAFQLFYIFLWVGSCLFLMMNKTNRTTLQEENCGLKWIKRMEFNGQSQLFKTWNKQYLKVSRFQKQIKMSLILQKNETKRITPRIVSCVSFVFRNNLGLHNLLSRFTDL